MRIDFKRMGVPKSHILAFAKKVRPYFNKIKTAATLFFPSDSSYIKKIQALANKKLKLNPEHCIVVGIGGSILGTQAVAEAMYGPELAHEPPEYPELIFSDTIDSRLLFRTITHVTDEPRIPLVVIVSKSGTTTETAANALALIDAMQKRTRHWQKYIVVITDSGSKLDKWARDEKIDCLNIPAMVGGRWSVFTESTLFPLAMSGIDIKKFASHARRQAGVFLKNSSSNPAVISAAAIDFHKKNGKPIHNIFMFSPSLQGTGLWLRQLAAESLGKKNRGYLPIVSIGTEDLHSIAQLYLDGPKNIFTTFLRVGGYEITADLPDSDVWDSLVQGLSKRNADELMQIISRSTEMAYAEKHIPFIDVFIPRLNVEELGAFMVWKMVETMLLGFGWGIGGDTFTQDAVEDYKKHVRKFLES